MKKFAVIAVFFLVLFESCQKDKTDDSYHVSFKEDGVDKTYTGHVFAHADTTSGYVTLEIVGANSSTSANNYLGFYIDNFPAGGNINTGQYEDNSTSYTLLTTYSINGIDYEAGQSVAQDAAFYNVPIANHFKVNITAMDDKTAKGTFSGDYYLDGDVQGGTKLTITNGDFYVRFQ